MKGFLLGALVLVVIEVAGRNADKLGGGLGVLANGVRRALAPNVAGLRNFAAGASSTSTAATTARLGATSGAFAAKAKRT